MPIANMLSITTNPFLSMMIWIVLLLATLYFARKPFHRAVSSLAKIIHNAMRLTATSVLSAEEKLARRNREVLLAAGLQKAGAKGEQVIGVLQIVGHCVVDALGELVGQFGGLDIEAVMGDGIGRTEHLGEIGEQTAHLAARLSVEEAKPLGVATLA